jgi:uncharacterized membrane protein
MREAVSTEATPLAPPAHAVLRSGFVLFALAIIALGIETFVCAGKLEGTLIQSDRFGRILGSLLAAGGVGLLFKRTARAAAVALGTVLFLYALISEVPRYATNLRSISSRTGVFEPLAIAALAWLLPRPGATPSWLARESRYLLAVSLIVFGVDHFLALEPIGTLIPPWIPGHAFWIAFFGAAFIAAGISIGLNIMLRWGAFCIGFMFAIWVFTLHLPRTLFGLYGGSGPHAPDEWSSLFIAVALWGGCWALARSQPNTRAS